MLNGEQTNFILDRVYRSEKLLGQKILEATLCYLGAFN